MKKNIVVTLISLLLLTCLSVLSAGAQSDTVNILMAADPVTLNMIESKSNLDDYVFYLTSAMLFRSVGLEVVPELCDTMTVSEDNLTYTYTIKDAQYSDGTPITADDFVYYFIKHSLTSENCTQYVGGEETYTNSLDTCEGVYAVDDKTFVVTLAAPLVTFTGKLEIYPVNRDYVASKGEAYGGTPADLQYSGPYILDSWTVGTSLKLHKNDSFINADTAFPVRNVNLLYASDVSTIYSMWMNNELDIITSVSNELAELLGEDNCGKYIAGNLGGLEFNTTGFTYTDGDGFVSRGEDVTALMKNLNFRMALASALDREALINAVDPTNTPYNRYVAPMLRGTGDAAYVDEFPVADLIPLNGDQEQAKAYLAAAMEELGYTDVSQLPKLQFLCFETNVQRNLAVTIVSLWKNVLGIDNFEINLQPIQSAIMSMVYMNYDVYIQQLTLDPDYYLDMLGYWETTGSVSDVAGFQAGGAPSFMTSMHINEEYDAVVDSLYSNFDDASRYADMAKAEQLLYSDFVFFPVYAGGGFDIVKDYVSGWVNPYMEGGYGITNLTVGSH